MYQFVGGQDVSIGAGAFPVTLSANGLPSIRNGDLIVLAFYVDGTATSGNLWSADISDNPTMCTFNDTLNGLTNHNFDFAAGNPGLVPTTALPGTMQFTGLIAYTSTHSGIPHILFTCNPQVAAPLSNPNYTSAFFSVAIYRGIVPIVAFGYDLSVVNQLSLVPPLTDDTTTTPSTNPPPNLMVGIASPSSGAPSGGHWTVRGSGIFVDEESVSGPVTLTIPGITGVLWLLGFSTGAPISPDKLIIPTPQIIITLPFCRANYRDKNCGRKYEY